MPAKRKTGRGGSGKGQTLPPAPKGQKRDLIDMNEAIAILKTSRPTFYRWLRSGKIKGMKVGRQWRFYREDVERFLAGEAPRVDAPVGAKGLLAQLEQRLAEINGQPVDVESQTEIGRAVGLMLGLAVAWRASDLHLAPLIPGAGREQTAVLRCRVDGVLHEAAAFDIRLLPAVVEEWKRSCACNVHEKGRPQDGRYLVQLPDDQGVLDLRVCFLPALFGESVTARLLHRAVVSLSLDRIDYAAADRERVLRALAAPSGLIVVTGPTGSGRTTSLYACLNGVAGPTRKTMTVEDPVEYALPWMVQTQVNAAQGYTFATAIRSILRSDPDVVMVGEIRDRESLHLCFQTAMTGHVVMTTMHADDAPAALKRMAEIGSEPFLIADTVRLVISQRLVRLLCRECRAEDKPSAEHLARARHLADVGGLDWTALSPAWRRKVGCQACKETGYIGRTVIAEVLEMTPQVRAAVGAEADVDGLRAAAVASGMTTMAADGVRRAAEGQTTLDEVFRVLGVK